MDYIIYQSYHHCMMPPKILWETAVKAWFSPIEVYADQWAMFIIYINWRVGGLSRHRAVCDHTASNGYSGTVFKQYLLWV